jgi:hypothetical protein
VLLATLREPPKRGSVRELVLSLFVLKRQQVEHARLRALAQIGMDKEKGVEAFNDYMKVAFPWVEQTKKKDDEKTKKALMEEVRRGGLKVIPIAETQFKSRLRTKVVQAQAARSEWAPKADRVLNKMGPLVPRE